MGKIGKVSTITREFHNSRLQTMESELSKVGRTRIPGTGVFKFPYKELDGKYRTGLDPDASYIQRIGDKAAKEYEIKRVTDLRIKLENQLGGIDLGPWSKFWNFGLSKSTNDYTHVQPYKLQDGDNLFDLGVTWQELTFSWLRVHPTIASSLQAWQNGDYPADTQFYVMDDEVENAVLYKKKQLINKAIVKLDNMTATKRIKVARLLGLPVSEDTKEEFVYNQLDTVLKGTEFKSGKHKGLDPVRVFTNIADMKDNILHIKDLVKQAMAHSIYREKATGKVYEGEFEIAGSQDELVTYLADNDNQDELLILEEKLKSKKLAAV